MKSFPVFMFFGLVGLAMTGCGPLQAPMPARPDADVQKQIDEAWDKALGPVDRFDHQTLLDLLMFCKAYEVGVDKLTFRSEKRVAVGKVVMEITYDRFAPAEDRFEIQILDPVGRPLRKERYGRADVEKTYQELFVESEQLRRHKEQGAATPVEVRKLAQYEARLRAIEAVFPKPDQKKDGKGKPERKDR
jgi:hypothetical protein